ncbi:MAG: hypothetical protein JNL69_03890 [Bacteroidia bacterium]|nr:hypothetical protein [Bacteroidia bacterium]
MKKIVLYLFASVLFSACDYDYKPIFEEPPAPLEDLAAYSYFKKGTYWIYKDSVSGAEDSVYVNFDTAYSYYQNNGLQAAGNYMFYFFAAHSFYDTYNYEYKISMGYYSITTNGVGVERHRYKPGHYVGDTYLMHNRFVNGAFAGLYTGIGATYFIKYYDSINILGHYYPKTAKFFDTKNESEYESPTSFYISKHIGIVRKERVDTLQTWNLIRYHIIQ